jgi:hypothetical protein
MKCNIRVNILGRRKKYNSISFGLGGHSGEDGSSELVLGVLKHAFLQLLIKLLQLLAKTGLTHIKILNKM